MLFPLLCWAEICLLLLCGGCQLEEPVMGLKEAVKSDSIVAAALGGEANFYCNLSLSMDVLQVTWQKKNGSSFQNIATYSPYHGLRLIGSFQKKVRFTRATLKASAITLQNLTFEDESCYRCIFNVFPHGSFSKDICLNIQSKNRSMNRSGVKILGFGFPNTKGVQKSRIIVVVLIAVVFLTILIRCVMRLINRKRKKLKRHSAPRIPAKEKGLHRDLSEKAVSMHKPKDQHIVYQNEEQSPGSSLHKRLPGLKRNLTEKKNCRRLFSEEVENLNSNVHSVFERAPLGLCVKELDCTPMKEDRGSFGIQQAYPRYQEITTTVSKDIQEQHNEITLRVVLRWTLTVVTGSEGIERN
ncbi:PREDICTED: uncharacterized protein LOC103916869 [Pygoscelis adeliae]|nr:PREDICTED: uncharacterized protein LOC103916869 [Pygoscelis adeliae]